MGWSSEKREAVELAFYEFLGRCYVNSKDYGRICLKDHLYDGQHRFIDTVFTALEEDIHKIYVLKSRQLGLSTIARALSTFMLGVHSGLKGAIVFDTDQNKQESRAELETMINDLPKSLRFPAIKGNNRAGLTLSNDSKLLFMSAGVRKSKTSGTLGRSVGLSLAHLSELCSYDNEEGLEAFEQSLSDANPDRLYIYESTARGFNHWYELWKEARLDTLHCRCLFLGWWSKESQKIDRDALDFAMYGTVPPSAKEQKKLDEVKELYGHTVTVEQLAWIRRKMDPSAQAEGDADPEYDGNPTRVQEQPWTEQEAFQQTGAVFFAAENLTDLSNAHVNNKFTTYMYNAGVEFSDMRIYKAQNARSVELKVWEEPDPDGVYVLGIDPAYGENEFNCRSAIQVLRCYADGVDQVAEYAWPLVNTRQLAWVIASLLGWYGGGQAEARYILELNGPGTAVFNELRSLRHQIDNAYNLKEFEERGLRDVFRNVKTYIYQRSDSLVGGSAYHFKTTAQTKINIMERLRDFVSNGMLHVRSISTIEEMKSVVREGDSIKGRNDDRTVALALAVHCWEEKTRRQLVVQRRTREAEVAKKQLGTANRVLLFQQNQLQAFFAKKRMTRAQANAQALRARWRYR